MKTDQNKIVDNDSIKTEAIWRCLEEMYQMAQPPCSFIEEDKKAKEKIAKGEEIEGDIIDEHYLSEKEYLCILDKYLDAYHLNANFKDHADLILDYLKTGGYKFDYDEETALRYRKKMNSLEKIIGKNNAERVFEYIEEAKNYYRLDFDESQFKMTVMNYAPTSNKKTVLDYYDSINKPIIIRERSEEEIHDLVYYGDCLDEYEICE